MDLPTHITKERFLTHVEKSWRAENKDVLWRMKDSEKTLAEYLAAWNRTTEPYWSEFSSPWAQGEMIRRYKQYLAEIEIELTKEKS